MHEFLLAVYWRFWQGQLLPYAAQAKRALYAKLAKGLFARFYGKRCSKYSMTLDAKGRNADLRQRSCKSIVVDGLGQGPRPDPRNDPPTNTSLAPPKTYF